MPSIGIFFEVGSAETLPGDALAVIGSLPELGKWTFEARTGVQLSTNAFMYPLWTTLHPVSLEYDEENGSEEVMSFKYKYTIFKSSTGEVKRWEDAIEDRVVSVPLEADKLFLVTDSKFDLLSAPTVCETTMEEMKKRWASFVPDWLTLQQKQAALGGFADQFLLTPRVASMHGFAIEDEFSALSRPVEVDIQFADPEAAKKTEGSPLGSPIPYVCESLSEEAKSDHGSPDVSISTVETYPNFKEEYEAALEEIDALRTENSVLRQVSADIETREASRECTRDMRDVSTECTQHDYKDEYEAALKQIDSLRSETLVLRESNTARDGAQLKAALEQVDAFRTENEALREANAVREKAALEQVDALRTESEALREAKAALEKAALEHLDALRTENQSLLRDVNEQVDALRSENEALREAKVAQEKAALEKVDALLTENQSLLRNAKDQVDALRSENKALREATVAQEKAALENVDALRTENQALLRDANGQVEALHMEIEALRAANVAQEKAALETGDALRMESQALRDANAAREMRDVSTECSQHDYKDEYEAALKQIDALRTENDGLREAAAKDVRDASTECSQHDYKIEYEAALKEIDDLRTENHALREEADKDMRDISTECSQEDYAEECEAALDEIDSLHSENQALREENRMLRDKLAEFIDLQGTQPPLSTSTSMGTMATSQSCPNTPQSWYFPTGPRHAPEDPPEPGELAQVLARRRLDVDSRAAHYSNEHSLGRRMASCKDAAGPAETAAPPAPWRRANTMPERPSPAQAARLEGMLESAASVETPREHFRGLRRLARAANQIMKKGVRKVPPPLSAPEEEPEAAREGQHGTVAVEVEQ